MLSNRLCRSRCGLPPRLTTHHASSSPTPQEQPFDQSPSILEASKVISSLDLPFESTQPLPAWPLPSGLVKTTGLHRAPLSGGVKTATIRYDLPSPPVGVRNLVEIARFGHLCTTMGGIHHRRAGYPFGTLIDFAADGAGNPIFCLSPLAIHSRNLLEDPRCSLVVQMPGWTGLANARVTIFGDTYQLPAEMQASARDIFMSKHRGESKEQWLSGNFVYFRMHRIVDIYFVGGFGTVQWISPQEYLSSCPDDIVLDNPTRTLQLLNDKFSSDLVRIMSKSTSTPINEVLFISIDASGADIRVKSSKNELDVERIAFPTKVRTMEGVMEAMTTALTEMKKCC